MKKFAIWIIVILFSASFVSLVLSHARGEEKEMTYVEMKEPLTTVTDTVATVHDTITAVKAHVGYQEIDYPTPKFDRDAVNDVRGVILHHTAEPTVDRSLEILTTRVKSVSTHVVIDTNGTRYILAKPEKITYHAGLSILDGRENCNNFTIGIEFQGNTLVEPLTENQIYSAIEYLKPIIKKYDIPIENIVTHEMVRAAYMKKYPHKKCSGKVDITQKEYIRFMNALKSSLSDSG
ncbi:MAG: N-acetylmuramoyl-L-alanine amidase [Prevotella sp.]|nr:N-acetylmuramoyl-L-alanine amidase [Prevotella sp.]